MTKTELARLAAMGAALRPDWPAQSLLTYLAKFHADKALRDVAVALAWIAADETTLTPARIGEPGPWWGATRSATVTRNPYYRGEPELDPDDISSYLQWLRKVSV